MSLKYREIRGYKYLVEETYQASWPELSHVVFESRWFTLRDGELTVHPGYAWDGASGPTIDTPATMEASLQHDVGYQLIRMRWLAESNRAVVDGILYRVMRDAGAKIADTRTNSAHRVLAHVWNEIRAGYFFAAVRVAGGSAAKPRAVEPQDEVHTV